MHRLFLVPAVLAGILALGCADKETPTDPTGPTPTPAATSLKTTAGGQQEATGSAFITLTEAGGASERITFSAVRHSNGSVSGQFELFTEQLGGVRLHGIVTCLGIQGTVAHMGVLVTQASQSGIFQNPAGILAVKDNGEGAGALPDESTDLFLDAPPEVVDAFCAGEFELPFHPSEQGNIQVHP